MKIESLLATVLIRSVDSVPVLIWSAGWQVHPMKLGVFIGQFQAWDLWYRVYRAGGLMPGYEKYTE